MTRERHIRFALAASLAAATLAAYSGLFSSAFISFDDPAYVSANPHVRAGVSAGSIAWAFTTMECTNWHPVTWISHQLDATLWDLDPGAHHRTSVVLHALNAALLFLLFSRMTAAPVRSAIVAALFAVHPLHVESVAWISERKDVLSTTFWLLALWAWVRYTATPSRARYAAVATLFALALMAKPMAVSFPFTLLLLELWPLARPEPLRARVVEKLPLFALSAASCIVTLIAQHAGGALQGFAKIPLGARTANAAVAYAAYLAKTVWPAGLAIYYPYEHDLPPWQPLASLVLIAGVTALALKLRRSAPYVLFGWLWYVGTLVPVIGLVQVGGQASADRYTYVPLIGIFTAVVWGAAQLTEGRRTARYAASVGAAVVLVAAFAATRAQVAYWRDGTALFTRALEVTSGNWLAHNELGNALSASGRADEAIAHYREAIRIAPALTSKASFNIGNELTKTGRLDEAIEHYERALAADPQAAGVHNNLGYALALHGRLPEAEEHYVQALRIDPGSAEARRNLAGLRNDLAGILASQGRTADAVVELEEAVRLDPRNAEAQFNLGSALVQLSRAAEAIGPFEAVVALRPDDDEARARLAAARAAVAPAR